MTEAKRVVTVYSDETKLKAMQAVAAGEPVHEAARSNGVNPATLHHWLRVEARKSSKHQLQLPTIAAKANGELPAVREGPSGRRIYSTDYKRELVARYKAGETIAALSRDTGVNQSILQRWARGKGLMSIGDWKTRKKKGGARVTPNGKRIGRPPKDSLPAPKPMVVSGPRGELQDVRSFLKNAIDEYRGDPDYAFLLMQLAYKHLLRALGK